MVDSRPCGILARQSAKKRAITAYARQDCARRLHTTARHARAFPASSAIDLIVRSIFVRDDDGAQFVGCKAMYLQDGTRTHFMNFIGRELPSMAPRLEKLYAKKNPPDALPKRGSGDVRTAPGCSAQCFLIFSL